MQSLERLSLLKRSQQDTKHQSPSIASSTTKTLKKGENALHNLKQISQHQYNTFFPLEKARFYCLLMNESNPLSKSIKDSPKNNSYERQNDALTVQDAANVFNAFRIVNKMPS